VTRSGCPLWAFPVAAPRVRARLQTDEMMLLNTRQCSSLSLEPHRPRGLAKVSTAEVTQPGPSRRECHIKNRDECPFRVWKLPHSLRRPAIQIVLVQTQRSAKHGVVARSLGFSAVLAGAAIGAAARSVRERAMTSDVSVRVRDVPLLG
jgi:hypothetical protein